MKPVLSFAGLIILLAGTGLHLSAEDFRIRSGRMIDPVTTASIEARLIDTRGATPFIFECDGRGTVYFERTRQTLMSGKSPARDCRKS